MDSKEFVNKRVNRYYWDKDLNCAVTTLIILSEKFNIELSDQVIDSAVGMHGAGEYGAHLWVVLVVLQCLEKRTQPSRELASTWPVCVQFTRSLEWKIGTPG